MPDSGSRIKTYSVFDRSFPLTVIGLNPWEERAFGGQADAQMVARGHSHFIFRESHEQQFKQSRCPEAHRFHGLADRTCLEKSCRISLHSNGLGTCHYNCFFFPFSYMHVSECVFLSVCVPILSLSTVQLP